MLVYLYPRQSSSLNLPLPGKLTQDGWTSSRAMQPDNYGQSWERKNQVILSF